MTAQAQTRPYNWNPELAINPREPSDAEYERNCRNLLREEISEIIDHLDSRLGELEPDGHDNFIQSLGELREYLRRDMEN